MFDEFRKVILKNVLRYNTNHRLQPRALNPKVTSNLACSQKKLPRWVLYKLRNLGVLFLGRHIPEQPYLGYTDGVRRHMFVQVLVVLAHHS